MRCRRLVAVVSLLLVVAAALPRGAEAADKAGFGVITPLSGGAAHYGTNFWRGVQMAVEDVNKSGGIAVGGTKVELEAIVCDDEFKSDKSVNCGRRLASMNKVPMIMTPASLSAFPLMGFNEKLGFLNAYQALQVAHRGYVMETGRIVLEDRSEALRDNPRVKVAYLGG